MPVTTSSKSALKYYQDGMKYLTDVAVEKGLNQLGRALGEDPDFFMANYQVATIFYWNSSPRQFNYYANAAINCKAKLSPPEELLRGAITSLRENRNADVTEVGKKLVDMYPRDPDAYNDLIYFQSVIKDTTSLLITLNSAIKMVKDPSSFYNQLGYIYMGLKEYDKAEESFNKYIELDPENPNVYDSKGDYYMKIQDYRKAYESFMRAYSIDKSWGTDKADLAKQLYEKREGRSLNIVPV
jgi:tetratricopeptide (TPR) repeat protein